VAPPAPPASSPPAPAPPAPQPGPLAPADRLAPGSTPASAGSGIPAREAFDAGRALHESGHHAAALPLLQQAYLISRSPNAHLLLARCLRELGRLAEAYEEMRAVSREASTRAESDPRYVAARDASAAELLLLERRVGRLVVALEDVLAEGSVELDGVSLPADRLGVVLAVMPGSHVVEAKRARGEPIRQEVTVSAGEMKTLALRSSAPAWRVVVYQPSGGAVRTAGYAFLGLGAAGMILFAVAGGVSLASYTALQHECATLADCADDAHHGLIDRGKTLQTVANVGLGFGAPALVTGGLMVLFGGPKKPPPSLFALPAGPRGTPGFTAGLSF
jgi:hypothetical protein